MKKATIYALIDAKGRRRYIGKSICPSGRLKAHQRDSKSWAISFVVLEECSGNEWRARERHWINVGLEQGWPLENKVRGGSGPPLNFHPPSREPWNKGLRGAQVAWNKGKRGCQVAWNKGEKLTAKQRENMGQVWKGRKFSADHRKAISDGLRRSGRVYERGWKHSAESIQKMSKSHTGKKRSPEHCANLSVALRGHTVTSETREKIAAKLRGRKQPTEQREKAAAWHRGRQRSADTKKKMREAWKRRKGKWPDTNGSRSMSLLGGA